MSFNKKSFAVYWEYRINSHVRQELTGKVKLALLEENWDLFHNQETFVEKFPDKAKEALLIMNNGGFKTPDILKYFVDEAERELTNEASKMFFPGDRTIFCTVENVPIKVEFEHLDSRGSWIVQGLNRGDDFEKVIHQILKHCETARCSNDEDAIIIESVTSPFHDSVKITALDRLGELSACAQSDLFYHDKQGQRIKIKLSTNDYEKKLCTFAYRQGLKA